MVTAAGFNSTLNQLTGASNTMDLILSNKEKAFQAQVRAFIAEHLPAHIKRKVEDGLLLVKEDYVSWQKILHKRGWMAPNWPTAYGGTGWTPIERYIFEEELAFGSTPRINPFGVAMVGPVIIEFGSEAQKRRFLPRILSSEELWCQGYSEPGAGSDLASLITRARRDGEHYIVNGAKTWTTMAQYADWIFCLVRTGSAAKKQEGISFLLIDMHSPGVSMRPIRTFDGGEEINEVYFDDVRVPVENLVGDENKGWSYAKFLLGHERTGIAAVGRSKKQLARVKALAARELCDGKALLEHQRFREKIAAVEIELIALEYTNLRIACAEQAGETMAAESSILKFRGTELQQAITELLLEVIGYYAHPYVPQAMVEGWSEQPIGPEYAAPIASHYFNWRKSSIYGGTNEVQKNIIAKMVLGL
jgi:alkylation response protein AidB-like acyl-CoA dehydrogenase